MREFQRPEQVAHEHQDHEMELDIPHGQATRFDQHGPIPPVSEHTGYEQQRTPGALAFDA